jgi:hypothetical protein
MATLTVKLFADELLIAETASEPVFCAVLNAILTKEKPTMLSKDADETRHR